MIPCALWNSGFPRDWIVPDHGRAHGPALPKVLKFSRAGEAGRGNPLPLEGVDGSSAGSLVWQGSAAEPFIECSFRCQSVLVQSHA